MAGTYNKLIDCILGYESDTFSASSTELTHQEACRIAEKLVQWLMDDRLDGVMISDALDEVREEPKS